MLQNRLVKNFRVGTFCS